MRAFWVWMILCLVMLSTSVVMAEPQRIQFKTGATSAQVSGVIRGYELKEYRFRADAGQQLKLSVASKRANWLLIGVVSPGSKDPDLYTNYIDGSSQFTGTLPKSGDYVLRLGIIRAEARRDGAVDYSANIQISPTQASSKFELEGSGLYRVQSYEPALFRSVNLELTPNGKLKMDVTLSGDGFNLDGTWHKAANGDGSLAVDIKRFAGIGDVSGSGLILMDKSGRPSHINLFFYYPEQKTLHALHFQVK